jgi:hypothetical protein
MLIRNIQGLPLTVGDETPVSNSVDLVPDGDIGIALVGEDVLQLHDCSPIDPKWKEGA